MSFIQWADSYLERLKYDPPDGITFVNQPEPIHEGAQLGGFRNDAGMTEFQRPRPIDAEGGP